MINLSRKWHLNFLPARGNLLPLAGKNGPLLQVKGGICDFKVTECIHSNFVIPKFMLLDDDERRKGKSISSLCVYSSLDESL